MTVTPLPLPVPAGPGSVPAPMGARRRGFGGDLRRAGHPAASAARASRRRRRAGARCCPARRAPRRRLSARTPPSSCPASRGRTAGRRGVGRRHRATAPLLPQTTAFLAALPLTAAVAPSRDVVVAATAQATAITAAAVEATAAPTATTAARRRRRPRRPSARRGTRRPPRLGRGTATGTATATAVPTADAAARPHDRAGHRRGRQSPTPAPDARDSGSRPAAGDSLRDTLPAASSQPVAATTGVTPPTVAGAVAGPSGPRRARYRPPHRCVDRRRRHQPGLPGGHPPGHRRQRHAPDPAAARARGARRRPGRADDPQRRGRTSGSRPARTPSARCARARPSCAGCWSSPARATPRSRCGTSLRGPHPGTPPAPT